MHTFTSNRLFAVASFVLVAPLAACSAPTDGGEESASELQGNQSAYTPLAENKECQALAYGDFLEGPRDASEKNCGGMGGYELLVREHGQVSVRTKTGDFDLSSYLSGFLGDDNIDKVTLGNKAEWRGAVLGRNKVAPTALIFRYNKPTKEVPNKSTLVVAKLAESAVCVYAVVDGNKADGNIQARFEADKADTISCDFVAPRPLPPTACGVISANTGLPIGTAIRSCQGKYTLAMQSDSNLVVYNNAKGRAIWNTRTVGTEAHSLSVGADGSFAIHNDILDTIWEAPTAGNPGASLVLQDDGNLVMYSDKGKAIWNSGTAGR